MRVHPEDGACRSCGGVLEVVDADDVMLTVQCDECGEVYLVEHDAFHDGCMTYLPGFLIQQEENRTD